jgi:cytoskeletal protein CcmA (bactofilin family)
MMLFHCIFRSAVRSQEPSEDESLQVLEAAPELGFWKERQHGSSKLLRNHKLVETFHGFVVSCIDGCLSAAIIANGVDKVFWNNNKKKNNSPLSNSPRSAGLLSSGEITVSDSKNTSHPAQSSQTTEDSGQHSPYGSPSTQNPEQFFQKAHSALSEGTVIQGNLSFDRPVRIDGSLVGKVFSSDALLLGKTSKVTAEIEVRVLVVEGKLSGKVTARERIVVLASAIVEADLHAPSITIENGAQYEGRCSMIQAVGKTDILIPSKDLTVAVEEEISPVIETEIQMH